MLDWCYQLLCSNYLQRPRPELNYNRTLRPRSKSLHPQVLHLLTYQIYGVVKVVTCLIFIFFLADSLGRRKSFMFGGAIQAFCMFFIGFVSPHANHLTVY